MRIDGEAHQRSEREVGPLRPKSQKIAAQRQISARQLSGMSGIFLLTGRDLQRLHWLAGAGGLEPPNGGIKIRCLTTWLRPIRRPSTPRRRADHSDRN